MRAPPGLSVVTIVCVVSACAYDNQPALGTTAWSVRLDPEMDIGRDGVVGASGHVVMYSDSEAAMFGPEGEGLLWYQQLERGPGPTSLAVGADGTTYALTGLALGRADLFAIAPDGSERWRNTFTWGGGSGELFAVLIDGAGSLWVLGSGTAGFDLGGGIVGGGSDLWLGVWGRFDGDGRHGGSGVLDVDLAPVAAPLPDREGFAAIARRDDGYQLIALDGAIEELYRVEVAALSPFYVHAGGELTIHVDGQLVHLDGAQRERWRVDVEADELTPLGGGGLLGAGADGEDALLQLVSPTGEASDPETFAVARITLANGPPSDRYYFSIASYHELDLHDRPIDRGGRYTVAREAPQ